MNDLLQHHAPPPPAASSSSSSSQHTNAKAATMTTTTTPGVTRLHHTALLNAKNRAEAGLAGAQAKLKGQRQDHASQVAGLEQQRTHLEARVNVLALHAQHLRDALAKQAAARPSTPVKTPKVVKVIARPVLAPAAAPQPPPPQLPVADANTPATGSHTPVRRAPAPPPHTPQLGLRRSSRQHQDDAAAAAAAAAAALKAALEAAKADAAAAADAAATQLQAVEAALAAKTAAVSKLTQQVVDGSKATKRAKDEAAAARRDQAAAEAAREEAASAAAESEKEAAAAKKQLARAQSKISEQQRELLDLQAARARLYVAVCVAMSTTRSGCCVVVGAVACPLPSRRVDHCVWPFGVFLVFCVFVCACDSCQVHRSRGGSLDAAQRVACV